MSTDSETSSSYSTSSELSTSYASTDQSSTSYASTDQSSTSQENTSQDSTNSIKNSKLITELFLKGLFTNGQKNQFTPTVDIDERLKSVVKYLNECNFFPEIQTRMPKCKGESLKYYVQGVEFFNKMKTEEALESFNKCIAFAETGSEILSIGYAKRSKAFYNFKLYEECLEDIKLIKKYCSDNVQRNLIYRKRKCNDFIKTERKKNRKARRNLINLNKVTNYLEHPTIPFIADCLEMKNIKGYGRSIITNIKLNVGDVIAIEKPFVSVLDKTFMYRSCANCLKQTFVLIPCPSCTTAMFCSQKCLTIAYKNFHRFECKIIDNLYEVLPLTQLVAMRILIQAIVLFEGIDRVIDFDKNTTEDKNIFNIEPNTMGYDDVEDHGGDDDNSNNDYDDYNDECSDDDVGSDYRDTNYVSKMTAVNYHPIHDLLKDVKEPANRPNAECLESAIEIAIANNALLEILKDFVHTDEHRSFIKNYLIRQSELARTHYNELRYRKEETEVNFTDYYDEGYGLGIYPFTALINHSCAPNIVTIYNGCNVTIVVLRPISKGEQLFDCYCDAYGWMKKSERRTFLKYKYLFACRCEACNRDYPMAQNLTELQRLPTMYRHMELNSENFQHIIDLEKYFAYLNEYSTKKNYPCLQIEMLESKLKAIISYRKNHGIKINEKFSN